MKTLTVIPLAFAIALSLSGCRGFMGDELGLGDAKTAAPDTASTFGSAPEQVWINKAKENFKNGEYGLAERYFRQAVEERHNNAEAWLGLAASYDHLKRFDEADRAYEVLTKMIGNTPTLLNNLGYHYMLKGDFASAEHALHTAQEKDPNNPLIRANLTVLEQWKQAAGRRS
jgi:Flp pilus assembly protein TadD